MEINQHQYIGLCIFFLSFFLFETCSSSEKAIGSFYETSANVTRCPTIERWLLVFERLPHLDFFLKELLSSLSGPKSRFEVTFSSPMLFCPWGCCQVSSRLGEELPACPSGDRLELSSERPWAAGAGAWITSLWLGSSFRGEKEEVDDGGKQCQSIPSEDK